VSLLPQEDKDDQGRLCPW